MKQSVNKSRNLLLQSESLVSYSMVMLKLHAADTEMSVGEATVDIVISP